VLHEKQFASRVVPIARLIICYKVAAEDDGHWNYFSMT